MLRLILDVVREINKTEKNLNFSNFRMLFNYLIIDIRSKVTIMKSAPLDHTSLP